MDSERKDGFDRDDPLWDLLGRASQPPDKARASSLRASSAVGFAARRP